MWLGLHLFFVQLLNKETNTILSFLVNRFNEAFKGYALHCVMHIAEHIHLVPIHFYLCHAQKAVDVLIKITSGFNSFCHLTLEFWCVTEGFVRPH